MERAGRPMVRAGIKMPVGEGAGAGAPRDNPSRQAATQAI